MECFIKDFVGVVFHTFHEVEVFHTLGGVFCASGGVFHTWGLVFLTLGRDSWHTEHAEGESSPESILTTYDRAAPQLTKIHNYIYEETGIPNFTFTCREGQGFQREGNIFRSYTAPNKNLGGEEGRGPNRWTPVAKFLYRLWGLRVLYNYGYMV